MKYCIHREGAPKGTRQGSYTAAWPRRKDEEENTGRLPKGTAGLEGDFWAWSFNYIAEVAANRHLHTAAVLTLSTPTSEDTLIVYLHCGSNNI